MTLKRCRDRDIAVKYNQSRGNRRTGEGHAFALGLSSRLYPSLARYRRNVPQVFRERERPNLSPLCASPAASFGVRDEMI
jgi:hypothetical protein